MLFRGGEGKAGVGGGISLSLSLSLPLCLPEYGRSPGLLSCQCLRFRAVVCPCMIACSYHRATRSSVLAPASVRLRARFLPVSAHLLPSLTIQGQALQSVPSNHGSTHQLQTGLGGRRERRGRHQALSTSALWEEGDAIFWVVGLCCFCWYGKDSDD